MVRLDGSGSTVEVGPGCQVTAPGMVGTVTLHTPAGEDPGPEQGAAPAPATPAFWRAATAAGIRERMVLELDLRAAEPGPVGVRPDHHGRSAAGVLVLATEPPEADRGDVVLVVDESGAVTWHLPAPADGRFHLPCTPATPASSPSTSSSSPGETLLPPVRGLFGTAGRRVVKVLSHPLRDRVLGPVAAGFARAWEAQRRPYLVRSFGPEEYRQPAVGALTGAQWEELASGPALLFLPGAFTTSHGSFGGLPVETMTELHRSYGGRLLAFDHFTLSHSPEENVAELAARIPDGVELEVDVVAFSRGGLVARSLAGELAGGGVSGGAGETPARRLRVRRSVFVATPNHGTPLAEATHLVQLLDRYTTVLNLAPPGPAAVVSEILEAILTVVRMLGRDVVSGLPGLRAMDPASEFLARLNQGPAPAADYYAVAADYEPTGGLLAVVAGTLADALADRVFADEPNDLVVPTRGVVEGSADPVFPIPAERTLVHDAAAGVLHTGFFEHPGTSARLLAWLTG